MAGKSMEEVQNSALKICKQSITTDTNGRLMLEVNYRGEVQQIYVTSLLAMYLTYLWDRVRVVEGENVKLSFALPHDYPLTVMRAFKEACVIAGINEQAIEFVDSSYCLVTAYTRKLSAIPTGELAQLSVSTQPTTVTHQY